MHSRSIALAITLTMTACGDDAFIVSITDDPSTSTPTTATAGTTSTASTSSTTGDDPTSTSTTDDATTGEPDTTTTTTGSTTDDPLEPMQCIPDPESGVTCEVTSRDWCGEAVHLAGDHLPETYVQVTAQFCREGSEPCTICFQIANTCSQVGVNCEGLFERCGCLAVAHGVL